MNKLILIPLILISISLKAQIEQYFFPSSEYAGIAFEFKTKPIENGKYYFRTSIEYSITQSGVIETIDSKMMYENGKPNPMGKTFKKYVIENNHVRFIHNYNNFFDKETFRNSIILKYPPSTWIDTKADPDVEYLYKSEFGKLTTKYGQYDCIIVTLTHKALNSSVIEIEKDKYIFYYAKGLGLVKEEFFVKGDLVDHSITGTLIDHFSKNSFEVMNENK